MNRRYLLQAKLEEILSSRNVYFQPPESIKMSYPCIIYELSDIYTDRADDILYKARKEYTVTVIDKDPDSTIFERVMAELPMCSFDRFYTADGLNHWNLILFY